MGATAELSSRAIRGFFYEEFEKARETSWIDQISNNFTSDQESEDYKWLTQSPVMREWIGGRNAKGFKSNGIQIENKEFEATIDIKLKDLRRDKTGQIRMRMGELVDNSYSHWLSLLSILINNGETGLSYDGVPFFSDSHTDTNSGVFKNLLTASEVAALNVATPTAPTAAELADAILGVIGHMYGFLDPRGEPRNENALKWVVMVPISLWPVAQKAIAANILMGAVGSLDNPLKGTKLDISLVPNARLTAADWISKFCVFRADARAKPLIRQSETEVDLKMLAEGSDYEFNNNAWQAGIDASRNVGFGMHWQASKATLS